MVVESMLFVSVRALDGSEDDKAGSGADESDVTRRVGSDPTTDDV